jgi:tetratricopeptide (TPR) repeat protein
LSRKNRTRNTRTQSASNVERDTLNIPRGWLIGLVLGVSLLAFCNTLQNGFAYDDTTQILQNPFIRDFHNIPKALVTEAWYWRVQEDRDPTKQDKPSTSYYRPVIMVYLMILWKLFGEWAAGWHFFNIVLHALSVYFAFLLLEKITRNRHLSALAALIFAVHPLRSESIAWISGVTDPLLAIFLLTATYLYIRYREEKQVRLLVGSLACFLFGAFVKEPAVVLPFFIAAYEIFLVDREKTLLERLKPAVLYAGLFLVVSVLYFAARYHALGFALNNSEFKSYPMSQVLLTIPLVVWKYIGLLVWPVQLSLFHSTKIVKSPLDLRFVVPLLAMVPLAFGLWRLRASTPARFAMLWFAINLMPVLNLSAFAEDFLVQERYVYIPSIGFSLLVAMGLKKISIDEWLNFMSRRTAQVSLVAVLVLLLGGKSLAQNTTWKDDMTVWVHGVETAPEQPISHFILGHKQIVLGQYVNAQEQFEEYMRLQPNNPIIVGNLASLCVLNYQNQAAINPGAADRALLDRAISLCEQGLKMTPYAAPLWDTAGQVYTFETSLKNYDRALSCFQRGLNLDPNNAMISFHLGGTLVKRGNIDEGIPYLKETIRIQPEIFDAHKFLAYAYKAKGQFREAADELNLYLRLQPNAPDYGKLSKDLQDLRAQLKSPSPQS